MYAVQNIPLIAVAAVSAATIGLTAGLATASTATTPTRTIDFSAICTLTARPALVRRAI
jgi:hypothetical protein